MIMTEGTSMTKPMPVEDVLALLALQADYADGADSFPQS
jgi:hypothetical protein